VPLGPTRRGKAETVGVLPALFADIDLSTGEHKNEALPATTRDIALLLAEAVPIKPSLVVHSGGGLHCYWLFVEPWVFESDEERQTAARLNRSLQNSIIAAAAKRGWKIEFTGDLARVFRPAGTLNRKLDDTPTPVRIIHQSDERYSVDSLEFYLPAEQEVFRQAPTNQDDPGAPWALWGHIVGTCGYLQHCVTDAATLDEPSWHAAMTIVARCSNGNDIAHRISQDYPAYDRDETDKKFGYSLKANAPLRCSTIRYHRGGERWCSQCPRWGTIASPILLGYPRAYIRRSAGAKEAGAPNA
jgi:hypothetical protein